MDELSSSRNMFTTRGARVKSLPSEVEKEFTSTNQTKKPALRYRVKVQKKNLTLRRAFKDYSGRGMEGGKKTIQFTNSKTIPSTI